MELKDIHRRLCPQLDYGTIRAALKETVAKKRAAMLAMAKNMVFEKILTECHILQVQTQTGTMVTSKALLNVFMKETTEEETIELITTTCFKKSPRWKEDMTQRLIESFGLHYDETTIVENKNKKGNGFLEKIVTKALNNVRLDLRAVQSRASGKGSRGLVGSGAKRKSTSSSSDEEETDHKRVSCFLTALFKRREMNTNINCLLSSSVTFSRGRGQKQRLVGAKHVNNIHLQKAMLQMMLTEKWCVVIKMALNRFDTCFLPFSFFA
jgi:hypothetical protein